MCTSDNMDVYLIIVCVCVCVCECECRRTDGSLVIGDTPVAFCCFLRTNLSPIFAEMAEHGRDPLVL